MALTLGSTYTDALQIGTCLSVVAKVMEEASEERGLLMFNSFGGTLSPYLGGYRVLTFAGNVTWPTNRVGYTIDYILSDLGYKPYRTQSRFNLPFPNNASAAGTTEAEFQSAHIGMLWVSDATYYTAIGEVMVDVAVGDVLDPGYAPLKQAAGFASIFVHTAGYKGTVDTFDANLGLIRHWENLTNVGGDTEAEASWAAMIDSNFFDTNLVAPFVVNQLLEAGTGGQWAQARFEYFVSPALSALDDSRFFVNDYTPRVSTLYAPSSDIMSLKDKDDNPISSVMSVFMEDKYWFQYTFTATVVYRKPSELLLSDYHTMRSEVILTQVDDGSPRINDQGYSFSFKIIRDFSSSMVHISTIT